MCLKEITSEGIYFPKSELIAKAYSNDWAALIKSKVWSSENESHLIKKSKLINAESYDDNLKLYVD